MQEMVTFVREDPVPSWWANALNRFLSVMAENFALTLPDTTTVRGVAGADDAAAVIAIEGKWRWREANIDRAHPGGAAGNYDVFVTAADNAVDNIPDPGTDHTNYAWDLAIVAAGNTPAIVAGTVDIFRKVGYCVWDGAKITALVQQVDATRPHADQHLAGGADPLPAAILNALVPIGAQIPYSGPLSAIPSNFQACDGDLILAADFPAFDALVGGSAPAAWRHKYNGGVDPGGGKVRKPDKRGRGSVGPDDFGAPSTRGAAGVLTTANAHSNQVGQRGGVEKYALTGGEHGAHTHSDGSLYAAAHQHYVLSVIGGRAGNMRLIYPGNLPAWASAYGTTDAHSLDTPGITAIEEAGYGNLDSTERWYLASSYQASAASGGNGSSEVNGNTGGSNGFSAGSPHENMGPYEVDNWIVRVA